MDHKIYVGLPDYRTEHNFDRLKEILEDDPIRQLPETFDLWLAGFKEAVNKHRRQGNTPLSVYIDADTFPEWCRRHGLNVNCSSCHKRAQAAAREENAYNITG